MFVFFLQLVFYYDFDVTVGSSFFSTVTLLLCQQINTYLNAVGTVAFENFRISTLLSDLHTILQIF